LGGTYSQPFFVSIMGVVWGLACRPDGTWHAILWQGPFKNDLGTLGGPDSTVYFGGPNASGQVAGLAETSTPDPNGEDFCGFAAQGVPSSGTCLGFLWQYGSMTPLSTLGGYNSAANAINNGGEVAGLSGDCSTFNVTSGYYLSPVHALLWDHGSVTNLGSLGGAFGNQAHGMNNRGEVVGGSDLAGDAVFHGFVWSQSTGMQDVIPLPGDTYSYALAINDAGQVTGLSIDASFTILRAFIVVDGVPTDLNTLISADSPLQLQTACAVNSRGEITGLAVEKSTGQYRDYLAIPVGRRESRE